MKEEKIMFYKNKNALITGGTGMIGRELVNLLLEREANVRVVSLDEPVGFPVDKVEFMKLDLTDYKNCVTACKGMDYVFHLAGIKGGTAMSVSKPLTFFIPMMQFNMNMMEAAFRENVDWYLYTSTYGVYHPSEISHEDDVWKTFPSEHDKFPGWVKRIGEMLAEGYEIQYDWNKISIVRPANVYGKWDNFDPENAMVIPALIRKADENDKLSVWGDGSAIRDFIHARDVARGMAHAVEHKITEPINLGSGTGATIKEIAEIISSYFDKDIEWDTTKPTGDVKRVLDTNRAKNYGFEPAISFEDGIKETIEWYKENKDVVDERYNIFKTLKPA